MSGEVITHRWQAISLAVVPVGVVGAERTRRVHRGGHKRAYAGAEQSNFTTMFQPGIELQVYPLAGDPDLNFINDARLIRCEAVERSIIVMTPPLLHTATRGESRSTGIILRTTE